MKIIGIVLLILGIIGLAIFGIQALNDSESFNVLGMDVAVSKANWTPVIVSAVVLVVGIVLAMAKPKRT
ncbi:transglycosylase [Sunxiuqinia elliptica]